ncbi:hypothetical protein [Dysgonomonas sp. ZJ279]|uniref:hypothetical protein n=1 Tax=Dysgonomonas sp. ZJ279 TaxID=2709796 RepID=UPI0013EA8F6F|nr:hypothetical protein [Dysgonomonas sp. ZJ279]
MKKLSAYTIASNCTDLTDVCDGIIEIREALAECRRIMKRRPNYYIQREIKLKKKLLKIMSLTQFFTDYQIEKLETIDKHQEMFRLKYSELALHKNSKYNGTENNKDGLVATGSLVSFSSFCISGN